MAYDKKQVEKIFDDICLRIENGESLRSVLRSEDMPSSRTFFKWLANDDIKVKQYATSTSVRADEMFEEMIDIADSVGDDMMTLPDGREVVNNKVIQRDKLRVDTRKWALSKMNPKKYSEKSEVTQTVITEQPLDRKSVV